MPAVLRAAAAVRLACSRSALARASSFVPSARRYRLAAVFSESVQPPYSGESSAGRGAAAMSRARRSLLASSIASPASPASERARARGLPKAFGAAGDEHEGPPEMGRAFHVALGNNLGYYGPHEQVLRGRPGRPDRYFAGCQAGQYVMGIESDGTVKGCPSLPTAPYAGGNVRTLGLHEIWAAERSESRSTSSVACPSTVIRPPDGSRSRGTIDSRVVLPLPVGPMTAVVRPASAVKLIPESTGVSAPG